MGNDDERLKKIKNAVREANEIGDDLLKLDHDEEIKRKAEAMQTKFGVVYDEIEKLNDVGKQSEALKELEVMVEKGSEVENTIKKKKGFDPFKQK